MSGLDGTWAVKMITPIGSIHADLTFVDHGNGYSGLAAGSAETVELREVGVVPVEGGQRVTWSQSITKPIKLNLDFDVIVRGDQLTGHSRAGRLPRSRVEGTRRTS